MIAQDATENGDAKYRCAECNLQFGTPRDLSRHLNKTARHGGQPSPCAICHKPLTRPDSRARHERRCRERFGVTEEMWQGIERERQRGRRKSISVDGSEEANKQLAGDGGASDATTATASTGLEHCGGGGGICGSSRSRTVSVSEVSDAELVAALASTKVASSAPGPSPIPASRYMSHQPSGESGASWTRRRSASLRAPHPQPTPLPSAKDVAVPMNGRKRRESSPHARSVLPPPPPPPQPRDAPTTTPHWRTLNRLPHQHPHHLHHHHQVRDESPPFEPPPSPMAIQDESDGEPMVAYRSPQHQHQQLQQHQQPRWTPLVKREERLVELAHEGEEDEEDELEDEDEPWHPPPVSSPPRAHNNQQGMMTGPPPPKKKLFGFEQDGSGTGGGIAGWSSSHKTQR